VPALAHAHPLPLAHADCLAPQLPSGTLVELGATWFHGVRDNPVYDMAVWQGVVRDVRCDPGKWEAWLPCSWEGWL
jgi:hypothetical protein